MNQGFRSGIPRQAPWYNALLSFGLLWSRSPSEPTPKNLEQRSLERQMLGALFQELPLVLNSSESNSCPYSALAGSTMHANFTGTSGQPVLVRRAAESIVVQTRRICLEIPG